MHTHVVHLRESGTNPERDVVDIHSKLNCKAICIVAIDQKANLRRCDFCSFREFRKKNELAKSAVKVNVGFVYNVLSLKHSDCAPNSSNTKACSIRNIQYAYAMAQSVDFESFEIGRHNPAESSGAFFFCTKDLQPYP